MTKLRHQWPWLLLLVPVAFGLMRLRLDVEVMNLLPDDFPVVRGLKLYQTNFSNARELLITIDSPNPEITESAAREIALRLRQAPELVRHAVWQPLWLESPGQSAELVAYLWFNQPPEVFGQLTNRLASTNLPALLTEAQEALTTSFSPGDLAVRGYDPFNLTQLPEPVRGNGNFGNGSEFFASPDGTFRVAFVEAAPDITSYRRCTEWLESIKSLVAEVLATRQLTNQVQVRYTGRPAFVTEIANGMEGDLSGSVAGTMLIVAALFWWAHRRWMPLLWIIALLTFILAATMALGGLIFGTLNVISMGFAAVLLGLAVDYGLVVYQESRIAPHLSAREIRRHVAPSVLWAALTTAGAFAVLNLGGLPGLAQLGTLVAVGVGVAAVVMLFAYLPPLLGRADGQQDSPSTMPAGRPMPRLAWTSTILLFVVSVGLVAWRHPVFDNSADALRPQNSPAYAAVEQIKQRLERTQEPVWAMITGNSEAEVAQRLTIAQEALQRAVSRQTITNFMLPSATWPHPAFQQRNRATAEWLVNREEELRSATLAAGFTTNAFALTERLLAAWRAAAETAGHGAAYWPTNESSRWVLDKFLARSEHGYLALGLLYRNSDTTLEELTPELLELARELSPHGIYVSGWEMLGFSIFDYVKAHFPRVLLPMGILLLVTLWCAFRKPLEILLSLASLLLSGLLLWGVMAAAGWSWNLMNLMALPLLLGAGVDYSIHMQLALRRHDGDVSFVRRSIGRALLLCGGTTVAGFGSLAWSSNAGMASLGKVCATGVAACMFTAIALLPSWWRAVKKK